jgi:hypothetical protein
MVGQLEKYLKQYDPRVNEWTAAVLTFFLVAFVLFGVEYAIWGEQHQEKAPESFKALVGFAVLIAPTLAFIAVRSNQMRLRTEKDGETERQTHQKNVDFRYGYARSTRVGYVTPVAWVGVTNRSPNDTLTITKFYLEARSHLLMSVKDSAVKPVRLRANFCNAKGKPVRVPIVIPPEKRIRVWTPMGSIKREVFVAFPGTSGGFDVFGGCITSDGLDLSAGRPFFPSVLDPQELIEVSTGLLPATQNGDTDLVKCLIANGADIEATNEEGLTALHLAADIRNAPLVGLLISNGANLEATNKHGSTPLHRAAAGGNWNVVELLVEKGARIDAKDMMGFTPLMRAVSRKQRDAVRVLLKMGADVTARANDGRSLFELKSFSEKMRKIVNAHGPGQQSVETGNTSAEPNTSSVKPIVGNPTLRIRRCGACGGEIGVHHTTIPAGVVFCKECSSEHGPILGIPGLRVLECPVCGYRFPPTYCIPFQLENSCANCGQSFN